jgi:UDP-N-acetylglucosamine 2-epimerase (non-hydrolysing)
MDNERQLLVKIHLIAAARPNFMKIAPLYHALKKESWAEVSIIHTGQHYDVNMSDAFFKDLDLPEPTIHLGVGSGTHAFQTGQVMIGYEKVLLQDRPDMVVVVGDVNSTMAVTIAASKLGVTVGHLEAGLRSFDRSMPEEINRIVTDSLADILWTPSPDADENLLREGVDYRKIKRVGNIMIDSLEMLRGKIESEKACSEYKLHQKKYGVVTLHRPSNVDSQETLEALCRLLDKISRKTTLVFPMHPRTFNNIERFGLKYFFENNSNILLLKPLNYIRFMNLVFNCRFVLTDSGGIQEETSYVGIPCLTLRPNTERPITVEKGTNRLCSVENLLEHVENILSQNGCRHNSIELWDGRTAERVCDLIKASFHVL